MIELFLLPLLEVTGQLNEFLKTTLKYNKKKGHVLK